MSKANKITYVNKPRESNHEKDKKLNERKAELLPEIERFISSNKFFAEKKVLIEFAHTGVSSLVCFISTETQKFVLKIPLKQPAPEGEAKFLKIWEESGVSVPHVFDEGIIAGFPYILMSYVDALLLRDRKNKSESELYTEIGKILHKMHTKKANGYGFIQNGKPLCSSFAEWIYSDYVQKRIKTVKEKNILDDEHGPISETLNILLSYCKDKEPTYCHDDFGSNNILATNPLTVIDPNPMLNNAIIDVGRTIQLISSGLEPDTKIANLKKGYFANTQCDEKALHAAVILSAYIKFYHWNNVNNVSAIKNTQNYLIKNRHLLGVF